MYLDTNKDDYMSSSEQNVNKNKNNFSNFNITPKYTENGSSSTIHSGEYIKTEKNMGSSGDNSEKIGKNNLKNKENYANLNETQLSSQSTVNDFSSTLRSEDENFGDCNDDSILCLNSLASNKTTVGYKKDVDPSINPNNITTNASIIKQTSNKGKVTIPFWANDPNIILNQKYIFEFFPTENMSYEQKLNAITRLIVLLTIIGFLFTQSIRLIIVSSITIFSIFLLYRFHTDKLSKRQSMKKENFASASENRNNLANNVLSQNNEEQPSFNKVFDNPSGNNPFSNVLMTDYDYNPNKKPAAPSYTDTVVESINNKTKELITNVNSTQPDINNKLFRDLGDELYFEQSMRQFYSNPSTTIPNDQTSFTDFCYGGMISCKEGNMLACARNMIRHQY